MPLSTLDSPLPSFFRQGTSAFTRLVLLSLLAVLLMLGDLRWQLTKPLRLVLATVLYPLQWAVVEPVQWLRYSGQYLQDLNNYKNSEAQTQRKLELQSLRANRVEYLELENNRLRQLLGLTARLGTASQAAQVIYDLADPYTRKVVIDKGLTHQIVLGSPVIDESGVLGQVTRVYTMTSEVTLVTDHEQAIPVLNT
jgi:rod shape-determining protein MreC